MDSLPERGNWRHDRMFWLILGLACVLALAYNAAILLGFGPDETHHLNYIKLLLDAHQLPVIENADPLHFRETGDAHAYHPPLYYVCLVPFYALFRIFPEAVAWHLTRAVSGCFCLASLPLLYEVAFAAFKDRPIARFTIATVAFTPMFGMTSSTVNNDAGALFLTSFFLYLLTVRFAARRDLKSALILGLVLGLGGLCKVTVVLCDASALLIALWTRNEIGSARGCKWLLASLASGALLVAPWHIRSLRLYGTWTPLPAAAPWFNPPLHGLELLLHPEFPLLLMRCNAALFSTLWSQRDWLLQHQTRAIGNYEAPQSAIYWLLGLFCACALVGHIVGHFKANQTTDSIDHKTARRTSYGIFALMWLTVLQVALSFHQGWAEGGRYLLPALVGFALFVARGIFQILSAPRAFKVCSVLWAGALLSLNFVSLYWLLAFLNPTYGPK